MIVHSIPGLTQIDACVRAEQVGSLSFLGLVIGFHRFPKFVTVL